MGELTQNKINTCPQSDLGLPTVFFQDVPVRRGRNSVPGSKHTSDNGSSSGLRSICPNHLNWDFKTWLLQGNNLQRFRTLVCEMRLIKGAGILTILLNIRACAPSREALSCFVKWNRCMLHLPLLHTNALRYSHLFFRLIGDAQTRLYRSIRPYIVPIFPATHSVY